MKSQFRAERVHTVVIGGGQAGLAVGYHLAKRGINFLILDANNRIGNAWRNRWDSLRLFTPARYVELPGMRFPDKGDAFPTKDQIADYLEFYAEHFKLPVQCGIRVDRLSKDGDRFLVEAGNLQYEADNVIVAMANYQVPKVPAFAHDLDPGILQLPPQHYKKPSQLQEGGVLVVGMGNSGADIAIDVARSHQTWIAGKESGHIPFPIDTWFARYVAFRVIRFLGHHVLTLSTPIGRRKRPELLNRATPLIRVKPKDLIDAGIERVGRVIGVHDGKPLLEGGATLQVKNVIWCTGYEPGFSWIDLPVFDEEGRPVHERGLSMVPGFYFVGLHFQYSISSATLIGVGRDADYVVRMLDARSRSAGRHSRQVHAIPLPPSAEPVPVNYARRA
ncbi:MAG TPA: FAD-dependent oxidoreductase [Candidatus Binatia bacterium]|nr:FAD-dependent oxidoreductase [Candidatus Binatia bacterium]